MKHSFLFTELGTFRNLNWLIFLGLETSDRRVAKWDEIIPLPFKNF